MHPGFKASAGRSQRNDRTTTNSCFTTQACQLQDQQDIVKQYNYIMGGYGSGAHLNIKMSYYQYRNFHYKDKTVSWPSHPYNRNPISGKYLCCEGALPIWANQLPSVYGIRVFYGKREHQLCLNFKWMALLWLHFDNELINSGVVMHDSDCLLESSCVPALWRHGWDVNDRKMVLFFLIGERFAMKKIETSKSNVNVIKDVLISRGKSAYPGYVRFFLDNGVYILI